MNTIPPSGPKRVLFASSNRHNLDVWYETFRRDKNIIISMLPSAREGLQNLIWPQHDPHLQPYSYAVVDLENIVTEGKIPDTVLLSTILDDEDSPCGFIFLNVADALFTRYVGRKNIITIGRTDHLVTAESIYVSIRAHEKMQKERITQTSSEHAPSVH